MICFMVGLAVYGSVLALILRRAIRKQVAGRRPAGMSALHDWHRDVFTKRTETTLVFPAYSTPHGGNFPEVRNDVTLGSARAVVCQRTVNALTPQEWEAAQASFDASDEGVALETKDPGERREHCELWLLHRLYESDSPDLVPASELALQKVLAHHAHPDRVRGHRKRLVAHVRDGKPMHHDGKGESKS